MQAVQFNAYGGPEVLEVAEAAEPHPGQGQVRVVVHASGVNPVEWKLRSGAMKGDGDTFPQPLGFEAAGVVDELGAGVDDVRLGDAVFGLGVATHAERAVLTSYVAKPADLDWPQAGGLPVAVETSVRVLDLLGVGEGSTVLVDGAAGGVGSVAVQVAVGRGARVIGTASEANHAYLSALGAVPVSYGDGMADRVREQAPDGFDAVFDAVGKTDIATLVSLVADPAQVVSIANFGAAAAGARVTGGGEGDPAAALREAVDLLEKGRLELPVRTFALGDLAEAHELSEQGHVRGKLVLVI